MHKITSKPIEIDCFEIDDLSKDNELILVKIQKIIDFCESLRVAYLSAMEEVEKAAPQDKEKLEKRAKKIWKELIRWLPEGWLQTRTVTMNYENLLAICSKSQRRFHKLNEWSGQDDSKLLNFIQFARALPYAQQFIFIDELN